MTNEQITTDVEPATVEAPLKSRAGTGHFRLPWSFRQEWLRRVTGAELKVLLCLGLHLNREGEAWPSWRLIAQETGLSEYGVRKALAGLVQYGLIRRRQSRHEDSGRFRAARYQIMEDTLRDANVRK